MGQSCSTQKDSYFEASAFNFANRPELTGSVNAAYSSDVESSIQYCLQKSVHAGAVMCLGSSRFLPTRRQIFSCGDDKNSAVIEWPSISNLKSAHISNNFRGHTRTVNRIAVDGRRGCLWSVSRDLSIRQWSIKDGLCMQTIPNAHELNISAVALDEESDGSFVYTGSRDYSVKQWDTRVGSAVSTYSSPLNIVTSLAVSSAGHAKGMIYQCAEDLKVRLWDPRVGSTMTPASEIGGYVYFALCMDIHQDGNVSNTYFC